MKIEELKIRHDTNLHIKLTCRNCHFSLAYSEQKNKQKVTENPTAQS